MNSVSSCDKFKELSVRSCHWYSFCSQLRITDFGLAKLVDEGHEYCNRGERLPIKWLASECIRSQIFSTKSDVWAFGVTLWEMFTFGAPPYPDIPAVHLLQHLDSGERLPQPNICTLDLFMLMIKCWLVDPISRPTFEEILNEMKRMAADPGRYLIIEVSFSGTDYYHFSVFF